MTDRTPKIIFGIDPGNEFTAIVELIRNDIQFKGKLPNEEFLNWYRGRLIFQDPEMETVVYCEKMVCMGMAVGKTVFDTCYFIGRLQQIAFDHGIKFHLVSRMEVKMHTCGTTRAKDANIRQAMIDRYGPVRLPGFKTMKSGKVKEIGIPGPTHGFSRDMWSALAIASLGSDKQWLAPVRPAHRPKKKVLDT